MTAHEIGWVIVLGAVVLAALATTFEVSPSWILGLAGTATLVSLVLATHVSGEPCGSSGRAGVDGWFFGFTIVASLTLYAAASLAAVVGGIRWRRAGDDRGTAVARAVGIPIVSAMGVVVVLFAFVYSIGPCLD
jgi:hypothetical protein